MIEFKKKKKKILVLEILSLRHINTLCCEREEISNKSLTLINLLLRFFATLSCIVENVIDIGCMKLALECQNLKISVTFWSKQLIFKIES